MLAARADDGRFGVPVGVPGTDNGEWRPTAPGFVMDPASWVGNVEPFLLPRGDLFRSDGPNTVTSDSYSADFAEVKALGSATSTTRTADQTEIAKFWADGGGTFTPPGHWNAIAAGLIEEDGVGLFRTARVFAQLDVALADAAIVCWETKFKYNFWRPVTAIRAAETDRNPATAPDAAWLPLLTTPPFPDYTSGHSTFSGAAATVLAGAFGANREFSTASDNGAITRTFTSLRAAADEAGMSRVYGGIHYRSANLEGLACGRAIGAAVVRNVL
jgi:membrane-associated phospholipid phosphatase